MYIIAFLPKALFVQFSGLLINMEPQCAIKKDATELIYFVIITFYFTYLHRLN